MHARRISTVAGGFDIARNFQNTRNTTSTNQARFGTVKRYPHFDSIDDIEQDDSVRFLDTLQCAFKDRFLPEA